MSVKRFFLMIVSSAMTFLSISCMEQKGITEQQKVKENAQNVLHKAQLALAVNSQLKVVFNEYQGMIPNKNSLVLRNELLGKFKSKLREKTKHLKQLEEEIKRDAFIVEKEEHVIKVLHGFEQASTIINNVHNEIVLQNIDIAMLNKKTAELVLLKANNGLEKGDSPMLMLKNNYLDYQDFNNK
jgi:hypothetical protein